MRIAILVTIYFLSSINLNAQTLPVFNRPISDERFKNDIAGFLSTDIEIYFHFFEFKKNECVNYLNLFEFQIDSTGKVVNLKNYITLSSSNLFNVYAVNNSLDSNRLIRINQAIDSIILLTNNKWTPAKNADGNAVISKPLLFIVDYTFFGQCENYARPVGWVENFNQVFKNEDLSLIGFYQGRRYYSKTEKTK